MYMHLNGPQPPILWAHLGFWRTATEGPAVFLRVQETKKPGGWGNILSLGALLQLCQAPVWSLLGGEGVPRFQPSTRTLLV